MLKFSLSLAWFKAMKLQECKLFYSLSNIESIYLLAHEYIGRETLIEETSAFTYKQQASSRMKLRHGTTSLLYHITMNQKVILVKMEIVVLEGMICGICYCPNASEDLEKDFYTVLSQFGLSIGKHFQTFIIAGENAPYGITKYNSTNPDNTSGAVMVTSLTQLVPQALSWITLSPSDRSG